MKKLFGVWLNEDLIRDFKRAVLDNDERIFEVVEKLLYSYINQTKKVGLSDQGSRADNVKVDKVEPYFSDNKLESKEAKKVEQDQKAVDRKPENVRSANERKKSWWDDI